MKNLHCLVSGRVQGVGFRAFVLDQAHELGLTGWTRNLPNGQVEAMAQGTEEALEEFARRLRKGPVWARVDAVEISEGPFDGSCTTFQVRL
ncbi:MAG: acylphosphatase [Desulfovibrio sp.]|nr:acylphosphatase [Desulfovibrio sp.]MBI4959834.1 acylphosphatase [Desulfovibrio sp.]